MDTNWFLTAFDFGIFDSSLIWGFLGILFAVVAMTQTYAEANILESSFSAYSKEERAKMERTIKTVICWISVIALVFLVDYVFLKLVFSIARAMGTQFNWEWLVSFSHMTWLAWIIFLGIAVSVPIVILSMNLRRRKQGYREDWEKYPDNDRVQKEIDEYNLKKTTK